MYELHVKDFSSDPHSGISDKHRGKFLAFTEEGTTLNGDGIHATGFDYLKSLGISHVHLLPVFDFGSVPEDDAEAFNWGYDPVQYNVPEGSYATDPFHGEVRIREMKEMVQALHKAGIGVIMDVVYNHTYNLDSPLQKTVPYYYYREWRMARFPMAPTVETRRQVKGRCSAALWFTRFVTGRRNIISTVSASI